MEDIRKDGRYTQGWKTYARIEDIRKAGIHTQGWKKYARMGDICMPKCSRAVLSSKKEMRPTVKSQPESLRQLKQHELLRASLKA